MAKARIIGMEMFVTQFERMTQEITKINRGALGSAAGFAADEMKKALQQMPVRPDKPAKEDHDKKLYGATESEKNQIIQNFGISTFRDNDGLTNTSIGFTGYVNTPSKRFHNQVPTGMLMQVIEYGNQFRKPTHIIGHTESRLKAQVAQKAQDYIDQQVEHIMN